MLCSHYRSATALRAVCKRLHVPSLCYSGSSKTYYDILGVDRKATDQEIRDSFLKYCKLYDRKDPRFIKIDTAYEVLCKPKKRRLYDKTLMDENAEFKERTSYTREDFKSCTNFFSVLKFFILTSPDSRISTLKLKERIREWQELHLSIDCPWVSTQDDWVELVPSALKFLAGEAKGLNVEQFVPYLDYKERVQQWQWIGVGHDSEENLLERCNHWLEHKGDVDSSRAYPPPARLKKYQIEMQAKMKPRLWTTYYEVEAEREEEEKRKNSLIYLVREDIKKNFPDANDSKTLEELHHRLKMHMKDSDLVIKVDGATKPQDDGRIHSVKSYFQRKSRPVSSAEFESEQLERRKLNELNKMIKELQFVIAKLQTLSAKLGIHESWIYQTFMGLDRRFLRYQKRRERQRKTLQRLKNSVAENKKSVKSASELWKSYRVKDSKGSFTDDRVKEKMQTYMRTLILYTTCLFLYLKLVEWWLPKTLRKIEEESKITSESEVETTSDANKPAQSS